ncbi:MAG TPA: carbonic anhydrase [Candidatus Ozemobacteraceae bacterium]|nr:carbonic anhydrase [Candidatus Ozemobacteraceae bacterium]
MKTVHAFCIGLMMLISFGMPVTAAEQHSAASSTEILQRLIDGNKRYIDAKATHPDQSSQRRTELAQGQHPFAVIVCCSDSRLPPEIIFDQGLGDLFVIRLAGNVLDDAALGSIEYAVEHLGVKLVMVLGHERCGAVEATIKGGEAPGHIGSLVKAIQPAVDKVKNQPGDLTDNVVRENINMVVQQVKSSEPILSELTKSGAVSVIGARYDLDDGVVEIK